MEKKYWAFGSLAFLVMAGMITLAFTLSKNINTDKLPIYSKIPHFSLTDSNGQTFRTQDLKQNIWLANFVFTSCGGECPIISGKMKGIQERFSYHPKFKSISISVDPERDNPERLKEYAKKYKANSKKWKFLTGEKESIKQIMVKGFKIGFEKEPMFHSDRFVLVDDKMKIRGYYSYKDQKKFKRLFSDLKDLLIKTSKN